MDITLTTPALLFSAISLLLLAYSNRYLAIAALIRNLHSQYKETRQANIMGQIRNLRKRMYLIRNMQACGVMSLFLCVFCMFILFGKYILLGKYIFGVSLVLLMISLALSVWEIQISVQALDIQLKDLEEQEGE
ncbi:MAG: DUF2721 domain-containing protein [Microscillaceae bacterium]|nr:DUF2721 domain-containing protein [Microscillaceae bacterium]